MENLMKRILFSALMLASLASFSGTAGCTAEDNSPACYNYSLDFGVQALALQLASGHAAMATKGSTQNGIINIYPSNKQFKWGYLIQGSYHFENSKDITLQYIHFDNDFNTSFTVGNGLWTLSEKYRWNQINLEFAKKLSFSNFNFRPHAGISWQNFKRIERRLVGATNITIDAAFNGIAPRVGIDVSYDITKQVRAFANTATALFYGKQKFTTTQNNNSLSGIYDGKLSPQQEVKAGLSYTRMMGDGQLTLQVAYYWVSFFGVLQALGSITDGNLYKQTYAFHGATLGVHWLGNIG